MEWLGASSILQVCSNGTGHKWESSDNQRSADLGVASETTETQSEDSVEAGGFGT
jgi:hypothetical protein